MSEEFNEFQKKLLEHFVTNTKSDVFVLRNLPEVIKGALFSRYSRSSLGLKALLLKEFIQNEETAFDEIVGSLEKKDQEQIIAHDPEQRSGHAVAARGLLRALLLGRTCAHSAHS